VEALARATAAATALVLALLAPTAYAAPTDPAPSDMGAEVVFRALSLLGVKYRFGGNTPESGLDCSGLVRLVFHETLGTVLPRRSEEISRVGGTIGTAELQPGDLVFFNTLRRAFSHVGIYIGNNQFVHAPSTGGSIRVERLDGSYWARRFDGARRLVTPDTMFFAGAPAPASPGPVASGDPVAALTLASAAAAAPTIRSAAAKTASAKAEGPARARPKAAPRRTAGSPPRQPARSPAVPTGGKRGVLLVQASDVYTH
jgi:hypothetical protein